MVSYMDELKNIMHAERERTGDYGNYGYDEEDDSLEPCPMCGSVRYEKIYKYKDDGICGCDDCIKERWAV